MKIKNLMNKIKVINQTSQKKILQLCICICLAVVLLVVIPLILQNKALSAAEEVAINESQINSEYIDTKIENEVDTNVTESSLPSETDNESESEITYLSDNDTETSDSTYIDNSYQDSITNEINTENSYVDYVEDNIYYGSTDELVYLGEFFATAYTHTGNNTATGVYPRVNHTVGVDPDIIPYGTTIVVEVMGELRTYVAEDTGYLDEYQLDIFYDTYDECIQFGVRDCRVWILE